MLTHRQELVLLVSKRYYKQYGVNEKFDKVVDMAIKSKNAEFCYKLAQFVKEPTYIKILEEVVIKSKNPQIAYKFAQIDGANIKALEQVVLDSDNARYSCHFAICVPSADIAKHQKVVEESYQVRYMCKFAMYVPKANKVSLCRLVIKNGNRHYNKLLQEKLPDFYEIAKMQVDGKSKEEISKRVDEMIEELKKEVKLAFFYCFYRVFRTS